MRTQQTRFDEAYKRLQDGVAQTTKRDMKNRPKSSRIFDLTHVSPFEPPKPSTQRGPRHKKTETARKIEKLFAAASAEPYQTKSPRTPRPVNTVKVVERSQPVENQPHLPLDFFDCENYLTESEKNLINNGIQTSALTKLRHLDGSVSWESCTVLSYDKSSRTFNIRTTDWKSTITKAVSRFNLRFIDEDIEKMQEREALAETVRRDFETEIRTISYLDALPSKPDMLSFLPKVFQSKIPEDVCNDIRRLQKMSEIMSSDDFLTTASSLGINFDYFAPQSIKEPLTTSTDFYISQPKIQKRLINSASFLKNTQLLNTCSKICEEDIKQCIIDFFDSSEGNIEYWKERIPSLREGVASAIKAVSEKALLCLSQGLHEQYIKLFLIEFVIVLCQSHVTLFKSYLQYFSRPPKLVYKSYEGFRCIDGKSTDISIGPLPPRYIIYMITRPEQCISLFRSIFDAVSESIEFLTSIQNNLSFTSPCLSEARNEAYTLIQSVVAFPFEYYKEISDFLGDMKRSIESVQYPSIDETIDFTKKISNVKGFLLQIFPRRVYFGPFALDLNEEFEAFESGLQNHITAVLQNLSDNAFQLMQSACQDYNSIRSSLLVEPVSPESFISLHQSLSSFSIAKPLSLVKRAADLMDMMVGKTSMEKIFPLYIDCLTWPTLLDATLGRAHAILQLSSKKLLVDGTQQLATINNDIENLSNSGGSADDKRRNDEFVRHLKGRATILQKALLMCQSIPTLSDSAKLWSVAARCKEAVSKWMSTSLRDLDPVESGREAKLHLDDLRSLTFSVRGNRNALSLLIAAKTDVESVLLMIRVAAQIKERHIPAVSAIVGDTEFYDKTLKELSTGSFATRSSEIIAVCQQTQGEEDKDSLLIETEKSTQEMCLKVSQGRVIEAGSLSVQCQKLIESIESIVTDSKGTQLLDALKRMMEVSELLQTVQDLVDVVVPLAKAMGKEVTIRFRDITDEIIRSPLLLTFSMKELNVIRVRDAEAELRKLKGILATELAVTRESLPRLMLLPDSKLVEVFAESFESRLSALAVMFPGIKAWQYQMNNITGAILDTNDVLTFTTPLDSSQSIIALVPLIESTIKENMRRVFFSNADIDEIPLQLSILRFLAYKTQGSNHLFFKIFTRAYSQHFQVTVENEKVYINKIEYDFMVVPLPTVFSKGQLDAICTLLDAYSEGKPIVIHSRETGIASCVARQMSFLVGMSLFPLHPTPGFPSNRIPKIVQSLNSARILATIDEAQLLSNPQLFDITVFVKSPLFVCISSDHVTEVLSVSMRSVTIEGSCFPGIESATLLHNEALLTSILPRYLHPLLIEHYVHESLKSSTLSISFLQKLRLILPPDEVPPVGHNNQRPVSVGQSLMTTRDFLEAAAQVVSELEAGKKAMLVIGPPFSGITTCVASASHSLGMKYKCLAFTSHTWVDDLFEALSKADDIPTVLHLMVPYDNVFLAHAASIASGGIVCGKDNELFAVGKKAVVVFELMTPISDPSLIPVPIITFADPLVKHADLLAYWMVNKGIKLSPEYHKFVQSKIAIIVESSLQLSLFFVIFSIFLKKYPAVSFNAVEILLAYCIYWANARTFDSSQWINYSKHVKSALSIERLRGEIFEWYLTTYDNDIVIKDIHKNDYLIENNESVYDKFSITHCGPIEHTCVSTPQFLQAVTQIEPLLETGYSCCVIGPTGSGKTTICRNILSRLSLKLSASILVIDGETTSTEDLYSQLISISTVSIDGIVSPRESSMALVFVDNFPLSGGLFGAVLSIIKTGNAVIDGNFRSFSGFTFLIALGEESYQLSTCTYPYVISPYSTQDFELLTREILTRIILRRRLPNSDKAYQALTKTMPMLIERTNQSNELLHYLCRMIRKVSLISDSQDIDFGRFFEFLIQNDQTHFVSLTPPHYLTPLSFSEFLTSLQPHILLFRHKLDLTPDALSLISYLISLSQTPGGSTFVSDDLSMDYELLTQFACSVAGARLVTMTSDGQLPQLVRESIGTTQPTLVIVRNPSQLLMSLLTKGVQSSHLPLLAPALLEPSTLERLDLIKQATCSFPFAPLNPIPKTNQISSSRTASSFPPVLSNSQAYLYRVKPHEFTFLSLHSLRSLHFIVFTSLGVPVSPVMDNFTGPHILPSTSSPALTRLLPTLSSSMLPNLHRIVARASYIQSSISSYLISRRHLTSLALSTAKAIKSAASDCRLYLSSTEPQLAADATFLDTLTEASRAQLASATDLSAEAARMSARLDLLLSRKAELDSYRLRDSSNTRKTVISALQKLTRQMTTDEQFKYYSMSKPTSSLTTIASGLCALKELIPRGNPWTEARALFRNGRLARNLSAVDIDSISPTAALALDVALSQLGDPPEGSTTVLSGSLGTIEDYLRAVAAHTRSAKFDKNVERDYAELIAEVESAEEAVNAAKERAEEAERLAEQAANEEKEARERLSKAMAERALKESFLREAEEALKSDYVSSEAAEEFRNAEKILLSRGDEFAAVAAVYSIDPTYDNLPFSSETIEKLLTLVCGTSNQLTLSLMAGERLVVVHDPHQSTLKNLTLDHIVVSSLSPGFEDEVARVSASGGVLVITDADDLVGDTFLTSVASSAVTSGVFRDRTLVISRGFRVVLMVIRPPSLYPPRAARVSITHLDPRSLTDFKDDAPLAKENLLRSLAKLADDLKPVHAHQAGSLSDIVLMYRLLVDAEARKPPPPSVSEIEMSKLVDQLQAISHISPLYAFPLSRIRPILHELASEIRVSVSLQDRPFLTGSGIPGKGKHLTVFHTRDPAVAAGFLIRCGVVPSRDVEDARQKMLSGETAVLALFGQTAKERDRIVRLTGLPGQLCVIAETTVGIPMQLSLSAYIVSLDQPGGEDFQIEV